MRAWFTQEERRQAEVTLIVRQLTRRLGEVDALLTQQIQRLSPEQLERLGVALLDFFEVSNLVVWLEQHEVISDC